MGVIPPASLRFSEAQTRDETDRAARLDKDGRARWRRRARRRSVSGFDPAYGRNEQPVGFHRVLDRDLPRPSRRAYLANVYGSDILYNTSPARLPSQPTVYPGVVLHDEPEAERALFLGERNPALMERAEELLLSDKWQEYLFLVRNGPDLAPETARVDELLAEFGMTVPAADPRAFLVELQGKLTAKYGRYILKPRLGFGSDGHLPTHKLDFGAAWDLFQSSVVPERERYRAEIAAGQRSALDPLDDEEAVMERIYERVAGSEGLTLEQLLLHPESVVAQRFVDAGTEYRVHVVEGQVLQGATVVRWNRLGAAFDPDVITRLDRAIQALVDSSRLPLGFTMDVIVTGKGDIKVIDLNPGYQSGMYYAEWNLFVANLLAEHFERAETPFLAQFRAFARAPLADKPALLSRLVEDWGPFVRRNQTRGFYDRIVEAYVQEVSRRPDAATALAAFEQLTQVSGLDVYMYELFFRDPRVQPALAQLGAAELEELVRRLAQRRVRAQVVDPSTNQGCPLLLSDTP